MTGIEAFLEILAGAGVSHLFGNPGTTELPLNAALVDDDRFRYIFGLHEVPVVAMADGYAMASENVAVINVHTACGLGNAMGMLYNAYIEGTPLLVTAGQQDRRLKLGEPVLEGNLTRIAEPLVKWSYEVPRVEDVPTAVRRALQIATTPPRGPVFLSLPVDVQLQRARGPLDTSPPHRLDGRVRPSIAALDTAARVIAEARHPVILAGSRVTEADAIAELVSVAERLGAPVYAESTPSHGRLPMPPEHPLYRGVLPMWSPEIHRTLKEFDIALAVGMNVLRLYIHREPEQPLPEHLRLVHFDSAASEIGKNYPPEAGVWGDLKCAMAELNERLTLKPQFEKAAAKRIEKYTSQRQQEQDRLRADIAGQRDARPLAPLVFMNALAKVLPADVAVVEEAITTHQNVFERLGALQDPRAFFAHRGWALGWGLGCALGVKLAWPNRPVLGLIGDGAALYGIQALWTAAHHQIPVTFVIANNAQYKILKVCGDQLELPELRDPRCPGLDLVNPAVDFVGLAQSFGVEAHRISEPDALSDTVRQSWRREQPVLFEVPVAQQLLG